ncbi:DUF4625 domain-containing protein [Tenacibaculum ovolyticum]|uniref:DUF4625 domain-containing protein n=1 Tax=Tenacibaculum ovolyticum TaxID=104270 RepID=UPI00041F247D|nr:DUF4625 domain-containing protein [Tenacibaculum ovolyticum]WBX77205.1 DUF4625 domain-containing protein [Tenacibaculum ovolyticum]
MNLFKKTIFTLFFSLLLINCSSDSENIDQEKPTITINYDNGFPKSCTVLEKGKQYTIKVKVSDNIALAKYAIDIHHNFDHHTHDDQGSLCELNPIKTPISPLIFMENYNIDNERKEYEISQSITIPTNIDSGDYHCQISVIDITGWQSRTSVDIKIE